jgi:O-antigen/teichoic acid export membrane protein
VKVPDFSLIKKYLYFGLPTLVNGTSYWFVTSVDRYIIGFFLGVLFVGYYAPAYSIGMLLVFFIIPINFVLSVVLPKFFDENNINEVKNYLSHSLKYYLLIMIPSVVGISILSRQLLVILSTENIAEKAYFVVPFVAVSTLLYGITTLISQILLLVKKTKLIAIIWVIAAFLNLVLNIIFIPKFGIISAAIITFMSYLCALSLMWYFAFKEFKFAIDWSFITKSFIASVLMGLTIKWINPSGLSSVVLSIILAIFVYGGLIFLFKGVGKKEVNFILSFIKSKKNYNI